MNIESIVTALLTSSGVVWITRTWISERLKRSIQNEYDHKLEAHKATLKAAGDVAIEQLRSQLHIEASRRQIEYTRIHEKRLEIISELAGRIYTFHQTVKAYVAIYEPAGCLSKEDRRKSVNEALAQLSSYYIPRKLFLPENTAKKVEDFLTGLHKTSLSFMFFVEQPTPEGFKPNKQLEVWSEAVAYVEKEAPQLIGDMERDFRHLLGMQE